MPEQTDTQPWPLIVRLCEALDEQLRTAPTTAALVELRRDLADVVPGLPPMPDLEQVHWLDAARAAAAPRVDPRADTPVPPLAQHVADSHDPPRPFAELSSSGLLWLINTVVFHPRGYALALAVDRHTGEQAAGWTLLGNGTEPWRYEADDVTAERFAAAEVTLRAAAAANDEPWPSL